MSHLDYPADVTDSASSEYHVKEAFSIDPVSTSVACLCLLSRDMATFGLFC